MNKIWLITQREFLSKVRKTSFIVMSVLGPLIFAGFFITTLYSSKSEENELKHIAVIDSTGSFIKKIPNTKYLHFDYVYTNLESMKKVLKKTEYYGILYISPIVAYSPKAVQLYSYQIPGQNILQHISSAIEKEIRNQKLMAYNIPHLPQMLKSVDTYIDITTIKLSDSGEENKTENTVLMIISYICSLLTYFFILMFGVQVMRSVIEEKTNRIIEVIITSVRPFQLMIGKVFGVALAALTQFSIWIVLSTILLFIAKAVFLPDLSAATIANQPHDLMQSAQHASSQLNTTNINSSNDINNVIAIFDSIPYLKLILFFLFYFIGGYLLYSSLFAAVGAASDNDTDTQQFVFPITIPLFVSIIAMINTFQNPDGPIAFWFSMIPFTSPIVMMARIPFGVPIYQLAISMTLLVLTFIGTIWLAGKIYRTGILMYGKKITFGEMIKWLRYKS